MKLRLYLWLLAAMLIGIEVSGLRAGERGRKESDQARDDSEAVTQAAARPGYAFSVELGEKESLPFVWIAPLKMWVGKYEVSNGQFRRYDAGHDSTNVTGREMDRDLQPVVHVSWEAAYNYCGWLNRHYGALIPTGAVFRLPTEQEWEAYARCGDQRMYPWGNQWPPSNDFNYRGTEGSGILYSIFQREQFIRGHNDGYVVSAPVAKSGVNTWGLYGVGGNVWEWCLDWFDAKKETRAIRGGAWNDEQEITLRVSHRAAAAPSWDNECIGFRAVIGPPRP